MLLARVSIGLLAAGAIAVGAASTTRAQPAPSGPPAVGVVEAIKRPITETSEFSEGSRRSTGSTWWRASPRFWKSGCSTRAPKSRREMKLYRLERGPFEADLASKQAQVAQMQATLENAKLTTDRARALLGGPAGQQSTYDAAIANQRSLEAQVQSRSSPGGVFPDQPRTIPISDRRSTARSAAPR